MPIPDGGCPVSPEIKGLTISTSSPQKGIQLRLKKIQEIAARRYILGVLTVKSFKTELVSLIADVFVLLQEFLDAVPELDLEDDENEGDKH